MATPTTSCLIPNKTCNFTITKATQAAPEGKMFDEWTITPGVTFVNGTSAKSATAKFTMPSEAVSVTAAFKDLAVTGITLNKTELTLAPSASEKLTVTAYQPDGVTDAQKGVTFFGLRELAPYISYGVAYDEASNTAIIESK